MTRSIFATAAIAMLALTGCVSFGPKTPKTLLTLTTSAPIAVNASRMASGDNTVTVLTPAAPAAIATVRVPVYDGATTLSYVVDVAWNEPPARLFQRVIAETIVAKTTRIVVDPRQSTVDSGARLAGTVQRFGIDATRMEAVVVFDAQLSRKPGTLEARRFEARVPVTAIDGPAIGLPLTQAANDVAAQVASWIG